MLITAILCMALAGCQHPSSSHNDRPHDTWRVMERVGDIRTTGDDGIESGPLRPGETIADNRQVTTSGGSLLILSRDGFQLTAGEDTSFRLPTADTAPDLFLDHGSLRVRLAKPVDQEVRIKTIQFDINASSATLTLRAASDGTNLTVDTGSAVLATTDGRHRAILVAGATAKMDPTSGDDLLIQPASGRGFAKVSPLPATSPHASSSQNPVALKEPASRPATAPLPQKKRASTKAPPSRSVLAILPASRQKKTDDNRPEPIANATSLPRPATSQPIQPLLSKGAARSSTSGNVIASSMHEREDDSLPITPPHDQVGNAVYDPLQRQFDRLVDGLVDEL